jgi:molecular chaperone GrpE
MNEHNDASDSTYLNEQSAPDDECYARLLRLTADFENFKRRTERDQIYWRDMALMLVLKEVLLVVDDFERARAQSQTPESPALTDAFGLDLMYKNLQRILTKFNVTPIDQLGEFNPALHEAVMYVDMPEIASGSIAAILQKGYLYKDQLLRPAKVSVAK